MAIWLLKTEPSAYCFDDLVRDKRTRWDGVKNPVALKNIRAMKKGDLVVLYHTGDEKAAVGLAEVVRPSYPDPEKDDERRVVIDIAAKRRLASPVTLAAIKAHRAFSTSPLVRQGRLSIVPLDDGQFRALEEMAKGS